MGVGAGDLLPGALVPEEEQPHPIPGNWVWARLGARCLGTNQLDPRLTPDEAFAYIDISSIDRATKVIAEPSILPGAAAPSRARKAVAAGDVLVSTVRPNLNAVAMVSGDFDGAIASTGFCVLRPDPQLLCSRYLFHWTTTSQFIDHLVVRMKGTSYPAVTDDIVKSSPIPVLILAEQRRLAGKLDSLLAKVAEARSLIDEARDTFAERRAAVLAAACSGRLTEDWRAKKGGTGSRPTGWIQGKVGEVGTVCNGSTPSRRQPDYWGGTIPWVSSGEVSNNVITATREQITDEGYRNSSVKLLPTGTVLLAMIGEGKTRGQSSVLALDSTINQNIAAVVVDRERVWPEYLWYWFQHQYEAIREFGGGTGPKALNCQKVRELPVVLPPLSEQHEIVRRVQSLFDLTAAAEQAVSEAAEQLEAVTQAILARAFRGELGTNDPAEPSALDHLRRTGPGPSVPSAKSADRRSSPPPIPADPAPRAPRHIPQAILAHLAPGHTYSRAELCAVLGLSGAEWTWAIRELKESGRVVQTGERRAARYALARERGAP